ncbi:hypothetical protein Bbelb_221730 [Branchiostoma belcheri]|nr:hypothetical protein Bbelb_221730 [Branchiostoma belcheri]
MSIEMMFVTHVRLFSRRVYGTDLSRVPLPLPAKTRRHGNPADDRNPTWGRAGRLSSEEVAGRPGRRVSEGRSKLLFLFEPDQMRTQEFQQMWIRRLDCSRRKNQTFIGRA